MNTLKRYSPEVLERAVCIALASVFIYHGLLKFLNLEGFTQMLPISYLEVVLVAAAETGGGLLVLLLRIGSHVSQGVQENNRPAAGHGAQRCGSEIGAT